MSKLLPWHTSQWRELLQRKAADRLPHALLCSGPAGLGKRQFAEYFAQFLFCTVPTPEVSACGICRSCRLFLAGNHPDYLRVEPAEEGKPIKVDQVRELVAFLGYTSQLGGYKIALLTPAERMNLNAANSLLKTLEEPPGNSLLVLLSTAVAQLPATIRSRCQQLRFQLPPFEMALAWLQPRVSGNAALLLGLSGGAPLQAQAYADPVWLAHRRNLFETYCAVVTGQVDPVRAAEVWSKPDVAANLRCLIGWQMDMIRLKMMRDPPPHRLLNPDLRQALQGLAERWSPLWLFQRLDTLIRLHALCATQVNRPLLLEALLGDCADSQSGITATGRSSIRC
ncbi:MAG TPA: DNA polymerase III subunit delta' [Candidatus Competibacteraceae bacterium]|nr:DNA polymerase III subunit delta' [Candidatus Competibacteraceae bacterium]